MNMCEKNMIRHDKASQYMPIWDIRGSLSGDVGNIYIYIYYILYIYIIYYIIYYIYICVLYIYIYVTVKT